MPRRKTTEEFIAESKAVHGDKYDYSLVEYISAKRKVKIICPEHGVFEQMPDAHRRGQRCPSCTGRIVTHEKLIDQFKIAHGDKYDYSLVNYINDGTHVTIICPKHGKFQQTPSNHKRGRTCPKCLGRSLTRNELIEQFREIHGDNYCYDKVEFSQSINTVTITCKVHGDFDQLPTVHKRGGGCPKCGHESSAENKRKDIKSVIDGFKEVHGDRYDYSLVEYVNNSTSVKIICPVHGVFRQAPSGHLSGRGCSKCSEENRNKAKFLSQETVINSFRAAHGDYYDYSLVDYVSGKDKVKIICPKHGVFLQSPTDHKNGKGCIRCGIERAAGLSRSDTLEVISSFKAVHGDKYDYSLVEYVSSSGKVKIICPTHGEFQQVPSSHKQGIGCPKCANNARGECHRLSHKEAVKGFKEVHGDRYDYSLVEYVNNSTSVKIICPVHGVFRQSPGNHKRGSGCPDCVEYGFKSAKPAKLYILASECGGLMKIGITNAETKNDRFIYNARDVDFPILKLEEFYFNSGKDCRDTEKEAINRGVNAGVQFVSGTHSREWLQFDGAVIEWLRKEHKIITSAAV